MININPITSASAYEAYAKVGTGKAADAGKSSAAKGEVVEISEASSSLKTVKNAIDALPEVRLDKVEEIRQQIKINNYPIENNLDESLKKLWQAIIA
jgi:flagellar biosynthesis anti-sigma factor FlgM